MEAVLYIHGMGGSADEARHYASLCPNRYVVGLDYQGETPWDVLPQTRGAFDRLALEYDRVSIIANSIGAYYAMDALSDRPVSRAFFISPIVDMVRLIRDMMSRAGVDEAELKRRGEIRTDSGETLAWDYLCYARSRPVSWSAETHVLYGERDSVVPMEAVRAFSSSRNATLTVMPNGEHWFHTDDQMAFLDDWLVRNMA